jgi:hypothetical protein
MDREKKEKSLIFQAPFAALGEKFALSGAAGDGGWSNLGGESRSK